MLFKDEYIKVNMVIRIVKNISTYFNVEEYDYDCIVR